ncbi:TPA: hypothetical protein ACNE7B_005343 [Escherichia coli]
MYTQKNRLQQQTGTGYASRAPHKTGVGISTPLTNVAHSRASGFLCVPYRHAFFAPELWWGVQGRLRLGRVLRLPVVETLYVSPP